MKPVELTSVFLLIFSDAIKKLNAYTKKQEDVIAKQKVFY